MKKIKNKWAWIFTALSSIGVGVTAALSAKNSIKAEKVEKMSEKAKCFIPTFISGGATIALILASHGGKDKQYAALTSACALTAGNLASYRNEVANRFGTDTDVDIVRTISAQEANKVKITGDSFGIVSNSLDLDGIHEQLVTFYDPISKRYFESTVSRVLEAEYHLNRNFALRGNASLNEFYEFLGIDKIESGDVLGWGKNMWEDGFCWIDFNHLKVVDNNTGISYYTIDCPFGLTDDYNNWDEE